MKYREYRDHSGFLSKEWRNECNELHSDGKPARIRNFPNGLIEREEFFLKGLLHREGEAAQRLYHDNGSIHSIGFFSYGKFHLEGAPAYTVYYEGGPIHSERFYFNGASHRELGPANTQYWPDGKIDYEQFCLHGNRLGFNANGFWSLWEKITDEQRKHPTILKCLARYS